MTDLSIQEIKEHHRLEEVVRRRGIEFRQTASQERLEAVCPFHAGDTTPSFNVYLHSQRYHCFGCGAHGDLLDFVQAFDLCSFQEALERLSTNIIPLQTYRGRERREPRPALPVAFPLSNDAPPPPQLAVLAQHYHQTLLAHPVLQETLRQDRGITSAGIQRCGLGYVDGSWADLSRIQGWSLEDQQLFRQMGVLNARGKERLYTRVVIPEWSENGCCWLVGRQTLASRSRQSPKYLGLSLPKPLLGYGLARQRVKQRELIRAILVVEGALDYVIATQWELPVLCVALIGTHASRRQLAQLFDLQQRAGNVPILLSLDADEAGQLASQQLLSRLDQRPHPVGKLTPIAGAKDIGDLGTHPTGQAVLLATIEAALEQVSKAS